MITILDVVDRVYRVSSGVESSDFIHTYQASDLFGSNYHAELKYFCRFFGCRANFYHSSCGPGYMITKLSGKPEEPVAVSHGHRLPVYLL